MTSSDPLVRVLRGGIEESVHTGALALVEDGTLVLARGDPDRVVFYRTASKPLQALELVVSGAADAFGLTAAELAIAAGSHSGEPRHLDAARSILAKAGVAESALRCGGHRSVDSDIAFAQRRDNVPVTSILSNCSGKHAGMLAAAKHRGDPLDGYLELAHPVQQAILGHVAAFAGLPRAAVFRRPSTAAAPRPWRCRSSRWRARSPIWARPRDLRRRALGGARCASARRCAPTPRWSRATSASTPT